MSDVNKKKNKKKNKKEVLAYDEDGGLLFMKNWSPALRWICILPVIIITYIIVKILFLGTVLNMIDKESGLLSLYLGAITSGLVYIAMIDAAAATAPKKRILTSIVTAAIFGLLIVLSTIVAGYVIMNGDYMLSKTQLMITLGLGAISNAIGLFQGVNITKNRQKKVEKIVNTNLVK